MPRAQALRPAPLADKYEEEPTRPLEAIAADLGKLMADTVFAGVEGLERDHRRFRERFGIGEAK